MKFSKKGFTLIELLVVVAIIGILAAIILTSLNSARSKARDAKRISDLRNLQTALEMYYLDHGQYPIQNPSGGCAWTAPLAPLVTEGYLPVLPKDPLNEQPYCYNYVSSSINSGWYCGSKRRTDYGYAIVLALEGENTNLLPLVNELYGFTHCVVGPLK